MRRRKRAEKNILPLMLVAFILSVDFADAIKGKWKPGNENDRRFSKDRTTQNDRRISTEKTIQNTRRIQNVGNMQHVRRHLNDRTLQNYRIFPNDQTLQNFRRYTVDRTLQNVRRFPIERTLQNVRGFPNDRSLQNVRRIPTDKTLQNLRGFPNDISLENVRGFPKDRTLQNIRGFPNNRSLQNVRGIPTDRTLHNVRGFPNNRSLQNVRGFPNDRTLQNVRGFPDDRTLQNVRGFPSERTLQNAKIFPNDQTLQNFRRYPVDRTLQNVRRFPIDRTLQTVRGFPNERTLQNVREFPIDRTLPNYRRIQIEDKMQNDRRMEYNKGLHSPRINVTDGIMQNHERINVNRLLEHNRRSQNELKRKIDSLLQNENIQIYEREQDGRRVLNARRIQNDRQSQKYLKERNRRILDARNQEMINFRQMKDDKSFWAATPHRRPKQKPMNDTKVGGASEEFNSSEFNGNFNLPSEEDQDSGWAGFWKGMVLMMEGIRGLTPPGGHLLTIRACYSIATTYITATGDFKKYYMMRPFYENNIQFEVGYLVAEIVSKYQRMLELFHMTTDYFFKHQTKPYAASTYVFYLYTNVLEMGTVIAHLCNMLTELEDKYRFIPVRQSGFSDYHLIKVMDDKETVNMATEVLAYEKKMAKLRREKLRERKKMRDKTLHIGMSITTPDRRPKYRSWPLSYGWSIEGTW